MLEINKRRHMMLNMKCMSQSHRHKYVCNNSVGGSADASVDDLAQRGKTVLVNNRTTWNLTDAEAVCGFVVQSYEEDRIMIRPQAEVVLPHDSTLRKMAKLFWLGVLEFEAAIAAIKKAILEYEDHDV